MSIKNIFTIKFNTNRIFGLDILRASAIMFVMLTHGTNFLPRQIASGVNKLLYDGVGIFFVLSGFLIGGILIKLLESNKIGSRLLWEFWIKRWFRTLPNYYLILIFILISNTLLYKDFNIISSLKYIFFLQNISSAIPIQSFFQESWSLSIEEWFYLITPIFIFSLIKFLKYPVRVSILVTAIFIILSVTLYRYIYFTNLKVYSYDNYANIKFSVLGRLDSLMYGVLGAYINYYKYNFWNKYKKLLLPIGICLFIPYYTISLGKSYLFSTVFSFTIVSISILLILPFFNSIKTGKGIFYKIVTYISLISYSLYLINMQVSRFLEHHINWDKIISLYNIYYISDRHAWSIILITCFILFWAFSIIISILLYKYYEVPMLKLRDSKSVKNFIIKYL